MSYASNRVCCDADSHILETPDWISKYADPNIRDSLNPLVLGGTGDAVRQHVEKAVARVSNPQKTAEIDHEVISGPKGWRAFGAFEPQERSKALDDLGFACQLVFSTFSASAYIGSHDADILYGGIRAHNRAMADFCAGDKRLLAVGQLSLADPERAVEELEEGLKLGCRTFWIPSSPAGKVSPGSKSIDRVWAAFTANDIPFMLHVGVESKLLPKAYERGADPEKPHEITGGENLRIKEFMVVPFAPQMFLTSLVFDGVFERFPKLRGGVIELGGGWVPEYLRQLDFGQRSFRKAHPELDRLSLKPSDYIRRAVKFTPFPGEDVGRMVKDAGADLFLFSSDYPHPEGTRDPIGRFERTMEGISESESALFYRKNFETLMGRTTWAPN